MLVTIGICVRNCKKTIGDTIQSVANQDFSKEKMELVIVDDGSNDNTLRIIKDLVPKIHVKTKIFHQNWKGLGVSRNLIVNNANGKYILWLDGDMKLPSDHIRKQVEFMESNPAVGAAKAQYGFLENGKLVVLLENSRAFDISNSSSKLVGTGGSIYRSEAIRGVGGFDDEIRGAGEDLEALIKIRKDGWLLSTTDALFYEMYKETWKSLWIQYYWWGFGAHYARHRDKEGISIATRLPPIAFLIGVLKFFSIFKRSRRMSYVLLPIHSMFKETAWLFGFFQAHFKRYGD